MKKAGEVGGVIWESPAFKVGMKVGQTIVAVNGTTYTDDRLRDAITLAKDGEPLRLTVKTGERLEELAIVYRGGNRYPALEKIGASGEVGLDRLLAPR